MITSLSPRPQQHLSLAEFVYNFPLQVTIIAEIFIVCDIELDEHVHKYAHISQKDI